MRLPNDPSERESSCRPVDHRISAAVPPSAIAAVGSARTASLHLSSPPQLLRGSPTGIVAAPWSWGVEDESWAWNSKHKSSEVSLLGPRRAQFHPQWSSGTAGVRGVRPLPRGRRAYWEVRVSQRVFGTSMMWGLCTARARLHADAFVDLLGQDQHGWGLSHKGLVWHAGRWRAFTRPFRENQATVVGMLFDGRRGTLTYYKDGRCLGVAFRDLHLVGEPLYPAACSTAAKTEMSLANARRDFAGLQDRCRAVILRHAGPDAIRQLRLPPRLERYLLHQEEPPQEPFHLEPSDTTTTQHDSSPPSPQRALPLRAPSLPLQCGYLRAHRCWLVVSACTFYLFCYLTGTGLLFKIINIEGERER
ncbi:SPRY domain SOCS box-containing protein [Ixodes scapularis]|uniref:SPRY domain-containing SOCS box protein 3 n=1 Tax=Ixodes scapularis TaxID=6945 RepID=B7PLM6_IXOSC|nr:SPRY domain SOCS box-containing protein [Ixodes scapularis]|eukprot:XP_002434674.1 SPRY domain SOCS box-containing protein [Ixodes scapularis]